MRMKYSHESNYMWFFNDLTALPLHRKCLFSYQVTVSFVEIGTTVQARNLLASFNIKYGLFGALSVLICCFVTHIKMLNS